MSYKSVFKRLSVRLTLLVFVLIAVPVGIALGILEQKLKDDFRQSALQQLDQKLDIKLERANTLLELAVGEVNAAVNEFAEDLKKYKELDTNFIEGVVTPAFFNSELYQELSSDLKKVMETSRYYLQTRILDSTGQEIIRFNRSEFGPVEVPGEKLQNKSKRDYFRRIVEGNNTVYIASVSLNMEDGEVTLPHTPMLRIGKKILLEDGRLFGIMVLNVHANIAFGSLLSGEGSRFLVIDEEGKYLHHWKEELLFGKDLGHAANLLAEEPELNVNLQKQDAMIHYDPELKEFRIWKKVYFDKNDRSKYWVFMERRMESSILSPWLAAVETGTAGLVFVLVIGISFFVILAHNTFTPLRELSGAISEMEKGELSARVKFETKTEMGDIGTAFNRMAEQLEHTDLELRRAMALASCISVAAPNSHIVADQYGKILTVNPVTEKVFGYKSGELVGENVSVLAGSPHRENHDQYLTNYLETGEKKIIGITRELVAVRKSGELFPVNLHVNEADVDGETVFVAIIEDITERKRADDALRMAMQKLTKANAEIKDFANIVSHDLRSPLVNLKGFSGELKEAFRDIQKILEQAPPSLSEEHQNRINELFQDEIPESFGFIDSSARVMERLVTSIMELARIGARKMKLTEVDIGKLIDEILKSMHHQMEEMDVDVKVNSLPSVMADLMSMDQIFRNILSNAVKYLDPDRRGVIEISGERRSGDTLFKVEDNGRGIPGYGKDKVFALFRRVVGKDIPGEGVGLAFVKALVERHEGEIWFETEEGKGTTFFFTIPHKIRTFGDTDG